METNEKFATLSKLKKPNTEVCVVLLAFAFIYTTTVFCVIVPWLSFSVPGAANLAALTFNTAMALYCYGCCMFLDAGRVPEDWAPTDEEQGSVLQVKRKGGGVRVCNKCGKPKPPRCHHCRVCQRCVLRMDHHCPWVNNCIGYGNYKAFYLFLLYVTGAVVHSFGLLAAHAVHVLAAHETRIIRTGPHSLTAEELTDNMHLIWWWALLQTIAVGVTLPLSLVLLGMLCLHTYLLTTNRTMIEFLEGTTAKVTEDNPEFIFEPDANLRHPYNLGTCNNLHAVLGSNPCTWFLPPVRTRKGGTHFPTIWQHIAAQEDGMPASPAFC